MDKVSFFKQSLGAELKWLRESIVLSSMAYVTGSSRACFFKCVEIEYVRGCGYGYFCVFYMHKYLLLTGQGNKDSQKHHLSHKAPLENQRRGILLVSPSVPGETIGDLLRWPGDQEVTDQSGHLQFIGLNECVYIALVIIFCLYIWSFFFPWIPSIGVCLI